MRSHQRSDLIAAQRRVHGDAMQLCECGRDAEPFSCYCQDCEDRMAAEEEEAARFGCGR